MALFDFAKDILGIAQAGAGIAGLFGRQKTTPEQKALQASIERSQQLSAALTDPNNPMLKSISAGKLQEMRDARLASMRDYLGAARREASRFSPRSSTFSRNPRRDEALARALAMAGQNEGAKADEMARSQIATALTGQMQAGGLARSGIEPAWMQQQRSSTVWPSALGAGRDLAGALERMSSNWGSPAGAPPVMASINDPNAGSGYPSQRNVNTRATGGLLGWA